MKKLKIISFGLVFILCSCGQSAHKADKEHLEDNKRENIDTSNQYIYDFMKVVIAEQNLNLSYGLTIEPEQHCDLSQDDKSFFKTLLIENSNHKKDTGDWLSFTVSFSEHHKCLTKEDIEEMMLQKEKLSKFTWNNSRLGFNKSNDQNWYSFSIPLFSKDRKKAVMMIRSLCPGLCGTGTTILFSNENDKWTSKKGDQWMH